MSQFTVGLDAEDKSLHRVASYYRRSLQYFQQIEQQNRLDHTLHRGNSVNCTSTTLQELEIPTTPHLSNKNVRSSLLPQVNNIHETNWYGTNAESSTILTASMTPTSRLYQSVNEVNSSNIFSPRQVVDNTVIGLRSTSSLFPSSSFDCEKHHDSHNVNLPTDAFIAQNFQVPPVFSSDSVVFSAPTCNIDSSSDAIVKSHHQPEHVIDLDKMLGITRIDSDYGSNHVARVSSNSTPKLPARRTFSSSLADIPLYMVSYDTYESASSTRRQQKKLLKLRKLDSDRMNSMCEEDENITLNENKAASCHSLKLLDSPSNIRVDLKNEPHHRLDTQSPHHCSLSTGIEFPNLDNGPSKIFAAQYDYVMVFPVIPPDGQSTDAKFIMYTMLRAGLELFPYLSKQSNTLFVLIRCPIKALKTVAERTNFKLLAEPTVVETLLAKGNAEKRIAPVKIKHEPNITRLEPYDHVYLRYQQCNLSTLYKSTANNDHPFDKCVRLKLIHTMLTAPKRLGGCNLEIHSLLHQRKLFSIFPLHDSTKCNELLMRCLHWKTCPWSTPNEELKEYLGEKIGLFNVFLGHMSWWLIPMSIIGIGCQVIVLATKNFSHPSLPIYTVLVIIWSVFMLSYWKREQSNIALRWGMIGFVDQQFERPEFYGELHTHSFIDGREMLYFSRRDFRKRVMRSLATIFTMVLLVLGVISAIYVLKFSLRSNLGWLVSGIASLLNVSQIMMFNLVYQHMAVRLTNQENHRTDTDYENALILKVFVFQFINSYASLFFLAFVAQQLPRPTSLRSNGKEATYVGQCGDTTCMRPLAINLGVIIVSRTIFKNIMDVAIPFVKYLHEFYRFTGRTFSKVRMSTPEMEYMLMEYDPILESVRKYADVAVQFGYTVLFAAALPLAPVMTLIYHYVKVKFQAWKLLTLHKRPIPAGAQSIESWQLIFTIVSVISVVTNGGIISFTMTSTESFPANIRVWIFLAFQWVMLLLQYLAIIMIPESSEATTIQISRIEAINQKLIDKFEDDDYDKFLLDFVSDIESPSRLQSRNTFIFPDVQQAINSSILLISEEDNYGQDSSLSEFEDDSVENTEQDVENRLPEDLIVRRIHSTNVRTKPSVLADAVVSRKSEEFETIRGLKRSQHFYEESSSHFHHQEKSNMTSQWWRQKSSEFHLNFMPRTYEQGDQNQNFHRETALQHQSKSNSSNKLSFFSNATSRLSSKLSMTNKKNKKQKEKEKKKKKLYRTRVLNPTIDASHLSPLPIFEYPQSDGVQTWSLPLTQADVGEESQLDILQLDI